VWIRPADFGELLAYLEHQRASLYLDGPNDVDWIFRNEVLATREETLYVDLVDAEGALLWLTPARIRHRWVRGALPGRVPRSWLDGARMLRCCRSPSDHEGLGGLCPEPDVRWAEVEQRVEQTLEELDRRGRLAGSGTARDRRLAIDSWTFPLHSADLRQIDVERVALLERRRLVLERLNADQ